MTMQEAKKRKGLFGAIWESMTKTGGCCGSGEDGCGPSKQGKKEDDKKQQADELKQGKKSCCGS